MPKHKQWLDAKKQTGKKKVEVRRLSKRMCWLLIIDAVVQAPESETANDFLAGIKITPEDVTLS